MTPLPPALLARLARAPDLVVAPVGLGFAQEALIAWAKGEKRAVTRDAKQLPAEPCLLWPRARSALAELSPAWQPEKALFLSEAELLFDAAAWRKALEGAPHEFIERSYAECGGWPEGLRLAKALKGHPLPLFRHPLVTAHLERLLPDTKARQVLQRAAKVPLVLPELYELLEVSASEIEALADAGYLYPDGLGYRLPALLGRYLAPAGAGEVAPAAADILAARGAHADALAALAAAGHWERYLELLAASFEPQAGEAALRRALLPLPAPVQASPGYRYLLGTLERLKGDLDAAHLHYRAARKGAVGALKARIDNARGICLVLQGESEGALKAFKAAARQAAEPRLKGEAYHNLAGVLIQQQRAREAEAALTRAIKLFRESKEYVREARSLQLLALGQHQRGLLREAQQGYREALELLGMLGQPTALLRVNLAEVWLMMGKHAAARRELDEAEKEAQARGDARTLGYVQVNRALAALSAHDDFEAERLLQGVLQREGGDAHLAAEAKLLLARCLRLRGEVAQAAVHAQEAIGLGLRAALEAALCTGAPLDDLIARARGEEARFELATALLHRAEEGDLREALELIRAHEYRVLLEQPAHALKLAELSREDASLHALFPLTLTLFGPLRVRFLGRELTLADFPTRKSAALLIKLAVSEAPQPRELLADALWQDAGNPLHSLQTALYHLSRTLGVPVVESKRGSLALSYPVQLDLNVFTRQAKALLTAPPFAHSEAIREALAHAPEGLLPELPEWFEEERREAEALKLRLLGRLADLEALEPGRAAEALETLLKLDPYDVEARERLIAHYLVLGEDELARREREQLALLERELS